MITLRKMHSHEFPAYRDYFIEDYGKEIVLNYGHSEKYALEIAQNDLESSFPDGAETESQELLCIESLENEKKTLVGYLHHCINKKDLSTYIYDFYIFENCRSLGYGKLAIKSLEKSLIQIGISQIKLRVAFENKRALTLYQEVGFRITGYNMSKILGL